MKSFLEELRWRGQLHQATGDEALVRHLAEPPRVAYAGFDPTSDSLHIGNYIPAKLLMHWQQHGHTPIVLMGGGTGLIGDPSGREAERSLMTREQVEANVASQRRILERLLDFDPRRPNAAMIVNNIDWLDKVGYIEMLRDIGKHFSVNEMIHRDSVRKRLEQREHGISYTEFSYVILQAFDFLHLRRAHQCTVQLGGADQYGNIVSGIDLIHREFGHDEPAFAVTAPLVERSDGRKMSKSEGTAVWLSADTRDATSPYQFYQYWINLPDADVAPWLKWFTLMESEQIESIISSHHEAPHERRGQRAMAQYMTDLIHGTDVRRRIEAATVALFSGDVQSLDETMLHEVFADVAATEHDRSALEGEGMPLVELLPLTSLASSKREAREFLGNGAISVNGHRVDADAVLRTSDLLHGRVILLRRGKKHWHATRWR